MCMRQDIEIEALRKQCAGLNEQVSIFIRDMKELRSSCEYYARENTRLTTIIQAYRARDKHLG